MRVRVRVRVRVRARARARVRVRVRVRAHHEVHLLSGHAEQIGHAAATRADGADGVRIVEVEVGRVLLLERDDLAQPAELAWLGPGIGIGLGIGFGFGFGFGFAFGFG